jgi:hypothetical protein
MSVHVDDVALLHVLALDQSKVKKAETGVENLYISQSRSSIFGEGGHVY